MNIEKQKRDAIEGMAAYIEECMIEVKKQMMYKDVDIEIVKRRLQRSTGTIEVLNHLVEDLTK